MVTKEGHIVRLTHVHEAQIYVGVGHGKTRDAAEEAALERLRQKLPPMRRKPLICLRRAGECQIFYWELWTRLP